MDPQKTEQFACEVRDVFSGDDLVVFIDLGVENLWKRQRIRLHGVDTPNAVNAAEDTEAGKVRKLVRQTARGRRGVFTLVSKNLNSWVGVLVVESQSAESGVVDVNRMLIDQGYVFKRAAA